jgi:UDP-2,3-diacylglucosamine hydrolase
VHHTLFISDLHLCDTRPAITSAFNDFLTNTASQANALFILGDLFEYWPGDDCVAAGHYANTIAGLRKLTQSGVAVFFMHGNRDFLIGETFAQASGSRLLPDPCHTTLYGTPVLMSHGDILCTDDLAYQQFRQQVRQSDWQTEFLGKPLFERIAIIEQLRVASNREKSVKSMAIMDVNQDAVSRLLTDYAYPPTLIHGHTHRPGVHQYEIDGHHCTRWVLGDWYNQGSYLRMDAAGIASHTLEL